MIKSILYYLGTVLHNMNHTFAVQLAWSSSSPSDLIHDTQLVDGCFSKTPLFFGLSINKIYNNRMFRLFFILIIGTLSFNKSFAVGIQQKNILRTESASESPVHAVNRNAQSDIWTQTVNYLQNNFAVLVAQDDISELKNSYISPYNYIQNPSAYNMGLSTLAGPNGTYQVAVSMVGSGNILFGGTNTTFNTDTFQLWGQTARWHGFALGGTLQGVQQIKQIGQPNTFQAYGVLAPTQAYLDYEKAGVFQVIAGNILLATPWVNSNSNVPGTNFANANNTYLGLMANVQLMRSWLLSGFRAYSYLQYPNSVPTSQNLYNTNGGPLANIGNSSTNLGVSGVGTIWNPVDSYKAQLWFYQFVDYANMWYFDNNYHLTLNQDYSMDFGLQALNQSSGANSITTYTALPGNSSPAGLISSNGIGLKWGINIPHDTLSFSYNNLFGPSGSYLNGGLVTPYTYGLETDPLYTTPALTSLAELGSGSAYTIRNVVKMLDNKLSFNLSYSQFFTNWVYSGQPTAPITEYDAAAIYHWTKRFNTWARMVYIDNPSGGGSMWQPRVILNYNF